MIPQQKPHIHTDKHSPATCFWRQYITVPQDDINTGRVMVNSGQRDTPLTVQLTDEFVQGISGFHRASLQSITFISRLNALDYTKFRI